MPILASLYPNRALTKKSLAVAAPSGKYEGIAQFIADLSLDIVSSTVADSDINIKIAHQEVKCPTETNAIFDTGIAFPNSATAGDGIGDNPRAQKKDVQI